MKKGYQSVQMRVWRYSEDIVTLSNEAGTPTETILVGDDFEGSEFSAN